MKNLLALAFILVSLTCTSQDIQYGIRGAINNSSLDFNPDANFENKNRVGFAFAGFAEFDLSDNLSFSAELQWSAEGGKSQSLRADYIKLPVLLKFSVADGLALGIGPQVALKTWKNRDGFSTIAFSGVAGAEYMLTDMIFVDARFYYGFTNILDDNLNNLEAKNNVFQLGLGIKM